MQCSVLCGCGVAILSVCFGTSAELCLLQLAISCTSCLNKQRSCSIPRLGSQALVYQSVQTRGAKVLCNRAVPSQAATDFTVISCDGRVMS